MTNPLTIFEAVVELDGARRAERLAELCGGDAALRAMVEQMLEADAAEDEVVVDRRIRDALVADLLESEIRAGRRAPEAALPDRIGPYRVLRVLGSGGMGVVYEAEEEHPQRRVALKVLHADLTDSDEILARFRGEVQTVADLRHPAIPRVFAAGEVDGSPWLAMERIEGAHLHHAAAGRPEPLRIGLLISVCAVVEAAHARGVLHCDLKPSNVIVDQQGLPHVLDFGLASTTRPEGDRTGTPEFMAPEQRRGEALDATADVFSLGRIGAVILPEASGDLAAVLARATAETPSDRYPSVAALRDDLERVRSFRPIAGRAAAGHRLRLFARRHRRALGLLALGAALLVGLLGGADALSDRRDRQRGEARERAAAARLERLRDRVVDPDREELFEDFAQLPENQGTWALAEAWMARGDVLLAAERVDEGRLALAEAYARAADVDQQRRALERLGLHFAHEDRWDQLSALLEGGHDSPDLRRRLALGTRRLDALPAPLSAWATGTRLETRAYRVDLEPGRDSLLAFDQSRARVERRQLAPGLPQVETWPMPEGLVYGFSFPQLVQGHPDTLLVRDAAWRPAIWRLGEPLATTGEGPPQTLLSHASDGGPIYVGTGGTLGRAVLRLSPPHWAVDTPSPELDALDSDVAALLLQDLDEDGISELVVAQGPWHAFAVTVLVRDGADGRWRVDATRQMGNVERLATLQTPDGLRLVAVVSPSVENRIVWGDDRPAGGPAGITLLDWTPGALDPVAFVPMNASRSAALRAAEVGDLDGDGDEDLVVVGSSSGRPFTWLLSWDEGGLVPLPRVWGLAPMAVAQVDADPELELVVRVPDDDHHTWVLGSGDQPLPPILPAAAPRPAFTGGSPVDPAIERTWTRAHRLADLGLRAEAARLLLRAEPLAASEEEAAGLGVRAAELLVEGGRIGEARRLLEGPAPAEPTLAARRHRLAVRTALLDRDWVAAEALEPDAAVRAGIAAELGWSGLPEASPPLDLLEPRRWLVSDPASFAIGSGRGRLDLFAYEGAVAATSFTPDRDGVDLRLDLALEDVEFGAALRVSLIDPAGAPALSVYVAHGGGGVDTYLEAGCLLGEDTTSDRWPQRRGHVTAWDDRAPAEPITLRVAWSRTTGRMLCLIEGKDGDRVREELDLMAIDLDGTWTIAMTGAFYNPESMARFRGVIHRLEIRAAAAERPAAMPELPRPPLSYDADVNRMRRAPRAWLDAAAPLDRGEVEAFAAAWQDAIAAHGVGDLAEGLLHPALDALDPEADGAALLRLGRAVALAHRGDPAAAAAELDPVFERPEGFGPDRSTQARARAMRVHLARLLGDREAEAHHTAAFPADGVLSEDQRLERLERWIGIVAEE